MNRFGIALALAAFCLAPAFATAQCCNTGCPTPTKTCCKTTYRTEVSCKPVTTYKTVRYRDCNGCCQTKCVPVTKYVKTCRKVPVTTCTQVAVPQPVCCPTPAPVCCPAPAPQCCPDPCAKRPGLLARLRAKCASRKACN